MTAAAPYIYIAVDEFEPREEAGAFAPGCVPDRKDGTVLLD